MTHNYSAHDEGSASNDEQEEEQNRHAHHAEMVRDFRRRFLVSLAATLPSSP